MALCLLGCSVPVAGTDRPASAASEAAGAGLPRALHAPCPAAPVLEDLHAALWLLERVDDRAEAGERIARARGDIHRGELAPGWTDFVEVLEAAAARSGGISYSEVEELRALLHESACLMPDLHDELHQRLRDPLGLDRYGPPRMRLHPNR